MMTFQFWRNKKKKTIILRKMQTLTSIKNDDNDSFGKNQKIGYGQMGEIYKTSIGLRLTY